jgi:deoxyribose-phosphate aldolase
MDVAFESLLDEAIKYDFRAVCVSPYIAVPIVRAMKPYPNTKVCTVVAFPHGNVPLVFKLQQASYFIENGVQEIDWVLNYIEAYNDNWHNITFEMGQMASLCRSAGVVSKCIVETGALIAPALIERVFRCVRDTGVDFIKTSTGYVGDGAKVEHIKLWNSLRNGDPSPSIKASGGIKTAVQALAMIDAGADRLGTSASVEIMEQYAALSSPTTNREGTPE